MLRTVLTLTILALAGCKPTAAAPEPAKPVTQPAVKQPREPRASKPQRINSFHSLSSRFGEQVEFHADTTEVADLFHVISHTDKPSPRFHVLGERNPAIQGFNMIVCFVDDADELKNLRPNSKVVVVGTVKGYEGTNITMEHCKIK